VRHTNQQLCARHVLHLRRGVRRQTGRTGAERKRPLTPLICCSRADRTPAARAAPPVAQGSCPPAPGSRACAGATLRGLLALVKPKVHNRRGASTHRRAYSLVD
jgi:hypothetical protein